MINPSLMLKGFVKQLNFGVKTVTWSCFSCKIIPGKWNTVRSGHGLKINVHIKIKSQLEKNCINKKYPFYIYANIFVRKYTYIFKYIMYIKKLVLVHVYVCYIYKVYVCIYVLYIQVQIYKHMRLFSLSPWTWQPAVLPARRTEVSQLPSLWWCSPETRCRPVYHIHEDLCL